MQPRSLPGRMLLGSTAVPSRADRSHPPQLSKLFGGQDAHVLETVGDWAVYLKYLSCDSPATICWDGLRRARGHQDGRAT